MGLTKFPLGDEVGLAADLVTDLTDGLVVGD